MFNHRIYSLVTRKFKIYNNTISRKIIFDNHILITYGSEKKLHRKQDNFKLSDSGSITLKTAKIAKERSL